MEKKNIELHPELCAECHCCQLRCSLAYSGAFNLERARLVPDPPHQITFTDECIADCSLCVRYCAYGALVAVK